MRPQSFPVYRISSARMPASWALPWTWCLPDVSRWGCIMPWRKRLEICRRMTATLLSSLDCGGPSRVVRSRSISRWPGRCGSCRFKACNKKKLNVFWIGEFGGHMLDALMACPNSSIALILISSFPVVLVMSDVHHNISLWFVVGHFCEIFALRAVNPTVVNYKDHTPIKRLNGTGCLVKT